ncbi:unnamed protein product [Chrysoparadoxa australica]
MEGEPTMTHGEGIAVQRHQSVMVTSRMLCELNVTCKDRAPAYNKIINFRRRSKQEMICVMCGGKESQGCTVPRQNKSVCKTCDRVPWHVVALDCYVKWCKGCKNFSSLGSFEEKPQASKCGQCRERSRRGYMLKKSDGATPSYNPKDPVKQHLNSASCKRSSSSLSDVDPAERVGHLELATPIVAEYPVKSITPRAQSTFGPPTKHKRSRSSTNLHREWDDCSESSANSCVTEGKAGGSGYWSPTNDKQPEHELPNASGIGVGVGVGPEHHESEQRHGANLPGEVDPPADSKAAGLIALSEAVSAISYPADQNSQRVPGTKGQVFQRDQVLQLLEAQAHELCKAANEKICSYQQVNDLQRHQLTEIRRQQQVLEERLSRSYNNAAHWRAQAEDSMTREVHLSRRLEGMEAALSNDNNNNSFSLVGSQPPPPQQRPQSQHFPWLPRRGPPT